MTSKRGRQAACWVVVSLLMAVAAACSDADSSAAPTTSIPPAEAGAASSTTLLATPEPTGVPGLDSPDPFCAAWATYAGTVQSLGIAASFGDLSSVELAGLELIAAPHVVEVGEAIDSTWPQDGAVAAERATVIDQRIGPYVRRAQRAVEALTAAGVTKDELSELSALWQLALSERDPQQPVIDVPGIRPDLQTRLDEAAVAYDRDVTPFAADPSLTTDHVAAPTTEQYLAEHCPDLASSGVGDSL